MKPSPSDDIFPWISAENPLRYHKLRPTAGVPIPEGNWYPVVVEVVDLVPESIPERVQYANMEDWRMDCPWWLVLTVIPVKRSASLFINVPCVE